MFVLIAYTSRHVDTIAGAPDAAEWVYVGEDPHDYWRVLTEFWSRGEDLMVLEHDVVCRPDVLSGFAACPKPWCLHSYHNHTEQDSENWRNALGATRFRRELVRAVPDALSRIKPQYRDWRNLCDAIGDYLRECGYWHHFHSPPVVHHQMRLGHLSIGG